MIVRELKKEIDYVSNLLEVRVFCPHCDEEHTVKSVEVEEIEVAKQKFHYLYLNL